MAIAEFFAGTQSVSTTEWSLATDAAGPTAQTTDGVFQLFIDANAVTGSDLFQLRLYEKAQSSDTQRVAGEWWIGKTGTPVIVLPAMVLINGWDFTLLKVTGTDRTITWSIRQLS